MVLDPVRNFAVGVLASGISESDTTITLQTGQGDKFPPTSEGNYNCVIWNSTDYTNPADDPNVEIVRVISRSGDTFTVQREQEGTTAVAHNTPGKTYKMMLAFTRKSYDDIDTKLRNLPAQESDVLPSVDNVKSLGSSSKRWANVYCVNLYSGDICLLNEWKITEDEKYGVVLVSPSGKRYRFKLEEIC